MTPNSLEQADVTQLKGVGQQVATKLAKLGLHNIQDVLFHLPIRYMDRTRISPIGGLQPDSDAVIEGEIKACDVVFGRRRSLMCRVQDNTGTVTLRFFHFSSAQKNNLSAGTRLRCFGEVRRGASGLELYHPEYQFIDDQTTPLSTSLTPVYPAAEGITQQRLRSIVQQALALLREGSLAELLPEQWRNQYQEMSLVEAIRFIHQPPANADLALLAEGQHPAQQRLIFEELLAHNLSLCTLAPANGAR